MVVCGVLCGCALGFVQEEKTHRKHKRTHAPAAARNQPAKRSEVNRFSTVQSDSGKLQEVREDLTKGVEANNNALERSIEEQLDVLAR